MIETTGLLFVVRRATAADTDGLQFIWQESANTLSKYDSRYKLAPEAASQWRADVADWLDRRDIAVFVAESTTQPGRLLGYIVGAVVANLPTLLPERYGYVSELAADAHGKAGGVGRGLVEAFKDWLRPQGITQVQARVPSRHPVAQAFWLAMGASELYEQMWLKLE